MVQHIDLIPSVDVETVFRYLSHTMLGRSEKASQSLFALAQTPAEMLALSGQRSVPILCR